MWKQHSYQDSATYGYGGPCIECGASSVEHPRTPAEWAEARDQKRRADLELEREIHREEVSFRDRVERLRVTH